MEQNTLEVCEAALSNAVYQSAILLERYEDAGLVNGNGHHAAQKLAAVAVRELRDRWRNRAEVRLREEFHPL